ncbi:MAG: hypothetical protein IPJ98_17770 [Bryobacterales bacterium]|nr:hypothetical protein [Bryobacterales bacterium]
MAVIVMLAGVSLVSTLAASITTFFVGQQEEAEMEELRDRMARMEAMMQELLRRSEPSVPPPYQEPTSSEPPRQS